MRRSCVVRLRLRGVLICLLMRVRASTLHFVAPIAPSDNLVTVIIKGTQVYDSSKGTFVDLSVLDVLQVFGRAGRPGLETSGEGYICTSEDKLTHYLDAITSQARTRLSLIYMCVCSCRLQNPIESQWVRFANRFCRSLILRQIHQGYD
jgi:hypothetical protein